MLFPVCKTLREYHRNRTDSSRSVAVLLPTYEWPEINTGPRTKAEFQLSTVPWTCKIGVWETGAGDLLQVGGQLGLHSEFWVAQD